MAYCNNDIELDAQLCDCGDFLPTAFRNNLYKVVNMGFASYISKPSYDKDALRIMIYKKHVNKKGQNTTSSLLDIDAYKDRVWSITIEMSQGRRGLSVAIKRAYAEKILSLLFNKDVAIFVNDRNTMIAVGEADRTKKCYYLDRYYTPVLYNAESKSLYAQSISIANSEALEAKIAKRTSNPKASEVYVVSRW